VPGAVRGLPIIPILGIVSVIVMLLHLDPVAAAVGVALMGVGLASGWLFRSRRVG
jgi:hypothetical protein